jgi:mercuric ion transport protein
MKRTFLLITGFLACPCHLPFVLPALAGLLAGTAAGVFIADNTALLIALATVYFVGVVVYFMRGSPNIKRLGSSKDDVS